MLGSLWVLRVAPNLEARRLEIVMHLGMVIFFALAVSMVLRHLFERRAVRIDDILGTPHARDYRVVPRVTFCDPQVASVGLTEGAARDAGHEVRTAIIRLDENERSVIDGRLFGLVKLVADAGSGELLGGHIVGAEAGAMIHEVVATMAGRVPASAIASAIHAYPTLSESIKGAFLLLAEGQ